MYGIINLAIKNYIVANYGAGIWNAVLNNTGLDIDFSSNDQPYNDATVMTIANSLAILTGEPVDKILAAFGQNVIASTQEQRSSFMDNRGNNLKEYLINLPDFHNRIMLIYPELTPPEFQVTNIGHNSVDLHYISPTQGIRGFVKGYVQGLITLFNEKVHIEPLPLAQGLSQREVFKISW